LGANDRCPNWKNGEQWRVKLFGIAPAKPLLNSNVALRPSELREPFPKNSRARLRFWIVLRKSVKASDPPHPVRQLRACRHRPNSRAGEASNKFAPPDHQ
jgi:hypothetical protein